MMNEALRPTLRIASSRLGDSYHEPLFHRPASQLDPLNGRKVMSEVLAVVKRPSAIQFEMLFDSRTLVIL